MSDNILEMRGITKTFPGVKALDDVNLAVKKGSIHALVGENGAGKSTLMNILSGVYPYGSYSGEIVYEGSPVRFKKLKDSEAKGIVIIHQELSLIPGLSIGENIFLGNEKKKRPWRIDWDRTFSEAKEAMAKAGLREDPHTLVKDLGAGKRQLVEIVKALSKNVRLLILDEPTSSLNEEEAGKLLDLLIQFKSRGISSVIISHKLNEISYVADRITVLRDGRSIETFENTNRTVDVNRLISAMVGRELHSLYPERKRSTAGEVALEVKNYTVFKPGDHKKKVVDDVSFYVRKGEIAGFAGLQGAGRTELCMNIFGRSYGDFSGGEVRLFGEKCEFRTPKEAIKAGLVYVTENRADNGLMQDDSIVSNTTLSAINRVSERGTIDKEKEKAYAEEYMEKMDTKASSVFQHVRNLSGGNQQKVLLSKSLFSEPKVLLFDEPTKGIDIGAKYDIYSIMNELAAEGKAIIMVSSEMAELLGMCDRIYVMSEGRIAAEFTGEEATQEKIMGAVIK